MASFLQLVLGVVLVLTFISLFNVNSLPADTNGANSVVIPDERIVIDLTEKGNHTLLQEIDCNSHGTRRSNGTGCDCSRGWTTHQLDPTKYCAYEQRSKQTAFFLSLFVGLFGIDWFYLSRASLAYIITGVLKLLLGCGCCGSWPLTYFGPEIQNSETVKEKLRGVSTCFSLVAFAWWIVDWARILGNKFPDGNGVTLMPW